MEIDKPRIPLEVRYFIIAQNTAGYKQLEIVDQVLKEFGISVSQGSVSYIISKYTEDKTVEDRSRSGRPKKLSKEEERALVKAVESDRTLNATRLFGDPKLNPPGPLTSQLDLFRGPSTLMACLTRQILLKRFRLKP